MIRFQQRFHVVWGIATYLLLRTSTWSFYWEGLEFIVPLAVLKFCHCKPWYRGVRSTGLWKIRCIWFNLSSQVYIMTIHDQWGSPAWNACWRTCRKTSGWCLKIWLKWCGPLFDNSFKNTYLGSRSCGIISISRCGRWLEVVDNVWPYWMCFLVCFGFEFLGGKSARCRWLTKNQKTVKCSVLYLQFILRRKDTPPGTFWGQKQRSGGLNLNLNLKWILGIKK